MRVIPLALICALGLSGCSTVAQVTASAATSLSSSTPSQVKTLAEADLAADTLVKLTKVAVDTNKLDAATLTELQALRSGLRKALDDLHAANAAGKNINFAVFNAAFDAYRAYATVRGVGH